jgi:hypothetical protein
VLHTLHPWFLGVQEGYRRDYRSLLDHRWGVRQRKGTKATAGVAVIWDRQRVQQIGPKWERGKQPHKIGHGWQGFAEAEDTRMRGVVWEDLELLEPHPRLPERFRVASWHRFPERDRDEWPEFDNRARHWLHESPLPVLVLQDSNEHGGPEPLVTRQYGWHADGQSIDGVLAHRVFHVGNVVQLDERTSDHGAAVIPLGAAA